jgi:hypothetical protein
VAATAAAVDQGELDTRIRARLLPGERRGLLRLAQLGGDHVEDPPPEPAQRVGVALGRGGEKVVVRPHDE